MCPNFEFIFSSTVTVLGLGNTACCTDIVVVVLLTDLAGTC